MGNWMPIDRTQCTGVERALPSEVQAACTEVLKLLYGNTGGCLDLCQLTSDGRQERAVQLLNQMGKKQVSADSLYHVLSDGRVEQDSTQFTALISAASNSYRTIVREHPRSNSNMESVLMKETRAAGVKLFRWLMNHAPSLDV